MNKNEFLESLKSDIDKLLISPKLINNKNQVFAWKLNAHFNRTFDEQFLWSQALYLSTGSCLLLKEDRQNKTAINGLSESAEIYESLGKLNNTQIEYDKDYFLILSALCYDLSGYQANAYCIANNIKDYNLSTIDKDIDLNIDNMIINQIALILTKRIALAKNRLENERDTNHKGYKLFRIAMLGWYNYILKQTKFDYLSSIDSAYVYFLKKGNVYLSQLLFLLKYRIMMFDERGIWNILKKNEIIQNNYQWKKYTKLLALDYYKEDVIKKLEDRKSIFEFWTSQIRAIEKNILDSDENFIVQMPTSTGKTFVAELMILKYLIKHPSKKCLYIAPFRALNNEKEIELGKYLTKLGYSVSSLTGAYEIDDFQDIILSDTNLLIATPEKTDFLLRFQPEAFNDISFIVVDEGHIIGDISTRATLLEFLIIRLRIKIKNLKILFISAVMPAENANEYSIWLNRNSSNVLRSLKFADSNENEEWEPTRKLISCFEWNNNNGNITFQNVYISSDNTIHKTQGAFLHSYIKEKEFKNKFPKKNEKKEISASLAFKLSEEGATLVFCGTVNRGVDSVAKSLLNLLGLVDIPDRFKLNKSKKSSYYTEKWYGDSYITSAIDHGIGIHYGDMPEQVRMAVEEDFKDGRLCVLLSTNTIGQGLNFPIKNIIFHKIQVGGSKDYIQCRDFWNIIGRAGRAGVETEGKIIFVIKSFNDSYLYNKFISKNNIEPAESLIFQVMLSLYQERLSQDVFLNYIAILSETYLLDLISEEVIGTDYEKIIEEIIENSLFKVQIDKKNLSIEPVKEKFQQILMSFENNATLEQLMIYKKTGLYLSSNKLIEDFIDTNLSNLQNYVNEDCYLKIVEYFLKMITENNITEMTNEKLERMNISPIQCYQVIEKWINGIALDKIFHIWQETTNSDVGRLHIFIANALYYLYPWGVSSFLIILSYKTNIEYKDLPENIKNIPSYLKYGLNKQAGCLARTLGIKSRETAEYLQKVSNGVQGIDFIRWLGNLMYSEINQFELSIYEKTNIREVSLKLSPNKNNILRNPYTFNLKGTIHHMEWMLNSKSVFINDNLEYIREFDNEYDPYAIIIVKNQLRIGYIPREYSKIISSEIDISDKQYNVKVVAISSQKAYNEIKVVMEESYDFDTLR